MKARHFALALRDYLIQKEEDRKRNLLTAGAQAASKDADQDAWALQYISIPRLQGVIEAFDDDASGFITIVKVNKFMSSKPVAWR